MKCLRLFCLMTIFSSCVNHKEISIQNKTFINDIAIYFLNDEAINIKEYEQLVKSKFPDFIQLDSIKLTSEDAFYIKLFKNPNPSFTPPDTNSLIHFSRGLTHEEKTKLQSYKNIISIVFCGTSEKVFEKQRRINQFISSLVKKKEVIISDFNSYEWFNTKSWNLNRVENFSDSINDITQQIAIHTYRTGEYCRSVTMGMEKFCLPDISIKDFSCSNQFAFANLINSVVQTLSEKPIIYDDSTLNLNLQAINNRTVREYLRKNLKKNAKETATIKLRTVKPEEGDNYNHQLLISFENRKYSSQQEEQEYLVANLFGAEDSIMYINHDSILMAASARAKQRLPELRELFNKGLEPGFSILLKAPFPIGNGGNEWMWVEVTKWSSESITGILQNDAYEISNLKAGTIVTINENEVFDYILYKPDRSFEGNETGKLLEEKR